jgi:hypothetical protein
MPNSAPVVDDTTATADAYNDLRKDIFEDHVHDENNLVDHGDLTETGGPIDGTYLTHTKLTKHVQGAGVSLDPDDPGGSAGVHGLPVDAFVMGTRKGAGYTWVLGRNFTDLHDWATQYCSSNISFGLTFTDDPYIVICSWQAPDNRACAIVLTDVDESDFNVRINVENTTGDEQKTVYFNWMAVGVPA